MWIMIRKSAFMSVFKKLGPFLYFITIVNIYIIYIVHIFHITSHLLTRRCSKTPLDVNHVDALVGSWQIPQAFYILLWTYTCDYPFYIILANSWIWAFFFFLLLLFLEIRQFYFPPPPQGRNILHFAHLMSLFSLLDILKCRPHYHSIVRGEWGIYFLLSVRRGLSGSECLSCPLCVSGRMATWGVKQMTACLFLLLHYSSVCGG